MKRDLPKTERCFLDALIKMKQSTIFAAKLFNQGNHSHCTQGTESHATFSMPLLSVTTNTTKYYGENTAVLHHTLFHDFPEPAKESRWQGNAHLRASELVTQPYVYSCSPLTSPAQSCANTNCTAPKPLARRRQKKTCRH